MGDLFGRQWDGEPFRLFDATHLTMLVALAALAIATVVLGRRLSPSARRRTRYVAASVLLLNVAGWHVWNLSVGTWYVDTMLPLHLCSIVLPVVVLALLTRHPMLAAGTWLVAAPGALQALITPEVAPYGFPHYRVIQSWVAHAGLFLAAVWLVFVEQRRPRFRHVVLWWVILQVYAAAVFVINAAIGSNYLYLNRKPAFATILDALPAWPWYLVVLEALIALFMCTFWLVGRRWGAGNKE